MDLLSPVKELFGVVEGLSFIRIVLGFVLVFFLPGFTWTLVFFRQIKVFERIVISFGLSIAVVTLSLFSVSRLLGVRIDGFNSVMVIIVVTILPVIVYYLNRSIRRTGKEDDVSDD